MSETIRAMLKELKRGLLSAYGGRLKGIFLFGSYARDEADEESDIDVLVVLDKIEHYPAEVERTSFLISQVSLKYGRSISCVYVTEDKWLNDRTMFFLNVREEAIPA